MGATITSQSPATTGTILGLISGEGKLPAILAQSAREKGYTVVAFALSENALSLVAPHTDAQFLIAPGQLGRNVQLMQETKCSHLVFVGKVPKVSLLRNMHKLDWAAIKELSRLPNFNDDTIGRRTGEFFEQHGLTVLTQSEFLRHLFPEMGVITQCKPTVEQYADIAFGLKVAKEVARLDIGQTVIVRDRMVVAVEAVEGTDEAIKRAILLARAPVVVVKVAKRGQDQRFDVPTVGMNTLNAMKSPKPGGVLAIEANETMIVDREEMVAHADANGISIVAV